MQYKTDKKIKTYLDALTQTNSIKIAKNSTSLFSTRNGGKSWIYCDHGDLICDPRGNKVFVDGLKELIEPAFSKDDTILLNVLSKASLQTTGALAYTLGYRQMLLQSEALTKSEKGTMRVVRWPDLNGVKKVVIIDDVLTTGRTVIEDLDLVKKHINFDINNFDIHLVVGLARKPEEATKNLNQTYKINPHWLATLNEIITRIWDTLTEEQKTGLQQEYPHFSYEKE